MADRCVQEEIADFLGGILSQSAAGKQGNVKNIKVWPNHRVLELIDSLVNFASYALEWDALAFWQTNEQFKKMLCYLFINCFMRFITMK